MYSRGQATSGKGVNEAITDRWPSEHYETQHTIGSAPDQAESTTKPASGGNLRPLSIVEAPCRSAGRLSLTYDGSSSEDHCWHHEVNTIRDTNPDGMDDPPQVNSPPLAGGNGTGAQAPTTGGNRADRRASVNSPVPTPP